MHDRLDQALLTNQRKKQPVVYEVTTVRQGKGFLRERGTAQGGDFDVVVVKAAQIIAGMGLPKPKPGHVAPCLADDLGTTVAMAEAQPALLTRDLDDPDMSGKGTRLS